MENQISINKVALANGMFLKVSYKELLPNNDERLHSGVSCSAPVHIDLTNTFKQFIPHLALICEEITNEEFIDALPEEYDATAPTIVEMGELVPAIKAARGKKKIPKGMTVSIIGPTGDEKDVSKLFDTTVLEKKKTAIDAFEIDEVEFKFSHGIESIALAGSK